MERETLQRLRCIALSELGHGPFSDTRRMQPKDKEALLDLIRAKHAALSAEEIVAQFNVLVNEKVLYPGADLGRYSVMA